MNVEKIKRLIELLVEREVKRQIPTIRKAILSELNVKGSVQKQPTKKQLVKNPVLNELLLSTTPFGREDDDDFDWRSELGPISKPEPLPMNKVLNENDFGHEAKTAPAKKILNVMNKDYSALVKKMDSLPKQPALYEEDLSFLDNVK